MRRNGYNAIAHATLRVYNLTQPNLTYPKTNSSYVTYVSMYFILESSCRKLLKFGVVFLLLVTVKIRNV
jgi:hypothetical protein